MRRPVRLKKDHIAGALLMALGIAIVALGMQYRMGALVHMGAGYIPVVLGVLMTAVGVAIAALAGPPAPGDVAHVLADLPDLRGGVCILGGVAAFVAVAAYGGLVLATLAAVFIAAMGDRQNTWKSAGALAVVMAIFGVVVFHFGLSVQMPLFPWS